MVRRDRQAPLSTSRRQRSGVIPRAALRRQRPQAARRDWLGGVVVIVLAVMVLAVLGGVFNLGGDDPGLPAAAVSSRSPSASPETASPSARPGAVGLPTATPSPTARPTPTATPLPTLPPTPTVRPTATPTRRPTIPPTPTLGPSLAPTSPPTTGDLVILEPADGDVVKESPSTVVGLAPAGATITHDIPFWFDDHTTADRRGRWSFTLDLVPGENEFTFRIGDDHATAQTITVVYEPK